MTGRKFIGNLLLATLCSVAALLPTYAAAENKPDDDIDLQIGQGRLRVEFIKEDVVRLRLTPQESSGGNNTGVCVWSNEKKIKTTVRKSGDHLQMKSDSLFVVIDTRCGAIKFYDKKRNLLLQTDAESPFESAKVANERIVYDEQSRHIVKTADGDKEQLEVAGRDTTGFSWKFRMNFVWQEDEALYGLGSHIEHAMNLRGRRLYLCQHNLKEMVPVVTSTSGYGLLFDAGCAMMFCDEENKHFMEQEAAAELDVYFMKGRNMDAVIKNYRWLTGRTPMLPKYMFGYIQSKERYTSSQELIGTLREFRERHIPIDMIVQDWNYWYDGQWGHMKMNERYYPDKKALTDSIHAMNAKIMVSIWPSMINSSQADDFKKRGYMLSGTSVYDAFNKDARNLYWDYANKEFFSNGFDAWWCDSTEPFDADWGAVENGYSEESHKRRWELCRDKLDGAMGSERSQLFSLYHSQGIYENQRAAASRKRVVNLTRSSYAGQQRYATITWNGDTYASWKSFAQMIPAGLNFMATGCPYWTIDAGAFFVKTQWQWFWKGEYEKGVEDLGYRELYTRMLQYATFLPVMRSHGTDTPREPWRFGQSGTEFYESIIQTIHLRYRLLPYIYSLAGSVYTEDYTMTRALAFDFPNDKRVRDIDDEFMFGPSLLVAPVTTPMYYLPKSVPAGDTRKERTVYLPAGAVWVDFYTGEAHEGGREIVCAAPIDRIPLFVRQGSILPLGPRIQHTSEKQGDAWEIRVYSGKDAEFTVYEDAGDGYGYEQGECSTFRMKWDDSKRALLLSDREGSYEGMAGSRKLRFVLVTENCGTGAAECTQGKTVTYSGKEMKIKL